MTTTSEGGAGLDAEALDSPTAYADALAALRLRAGMSVREVSRAAGIPSATLGGYFSGRHLPSPTQPAVLARLLSALGIEAEDQQPWHDALVRVRRTPGRRPSAAPPYRGLESFGVDQAHLFFGRERLTDELVALVETVGGSSAGPRFVTVLAPSGAGKSSLVRAGLLERRRAPGDVLLTPAQVIAGGGGFEARGLAPRPPEGRLVVVDQFEQVLHPAVPTDVRGAFLGRLAELADPAGSTVVVVTLRADWFAAAVAEPQLLPLLGAHQLLVGPITREELTRAVLEPARATGTDVDPAVAELVWRDVEESGAHAEQAVLPLLSHALLAAWQRTDGARLGVGEYLEVGGLASAVTRTAEHVVAGLPSGGSAAARLLFAQLVEVTDEGVATRRPLSWEELAGLPAEIAEVAEAFVASRIVTATAGGLEISHDAVLEAWPRLQQWIDDDREQLRIRRRLRGASDIWVEHGEDDGSLARGVLLEHGRALLDAPTVAVGPQLRRFVEASTAHAERQAGVERRRRSTMRALFVAVVALAVLASGLSVYLGHTAAVAGSQRRAAQTARDNALSRQVALEANELRTTAPALANQLAVAAYRIAPTVDARSALFRSSDRPASTRLIGVTGTMSASVSPDGRLVVVSGADGSVTVWRRAGPSVAPHRIARLATGTPAPLYAGAFSADGRLYFTGGQGRLVAIDLTDPAHPVLWPHELTGVKTTVQTLAFRDGILYAGTSDPSLLRWRISDSGATPLPAVRGFRGDVRGVAVAPDGVVATASLDGVLRLWRPVGTGLRRTWQRQIASAGRPIYAAAFSPDGRLLVDTGAEGHADVWRRTGASGGSARHVRRLGGFKSYVNGAAFSHDGRVVAVAASGNETRLWSTQGWRPAGQYDGTANMTGVSFLPGDRQLLISSIDGTARLESLDAPVLPDVGHPIWSVQWAAAGRRAFASYNGVVEVLDTSDPAALRVLHRLVAPASAGAISGVVDVTPDASVAVAGTVSGALVMWRLGTGGAPLGKPTAVQPSTMLVESVDVSADGRRVVATGDGGQIAVYDITATGLALHATADLGELPLGLGTAINADGSLVAVGTGDKRLLVYRVGGSSLRLVSTIGDFENYVYGVAFDPTRPLLAGGSNDKTVRVYDISDPARPRPFGPTLRDAGDSTNVVAFSADGRLLAGSSNQAGVTVWRVGTDRATVLARLHGGDLGNVSVAFAPDGRRLLAGGSDGGLNAWSTDVDGDVHRLCAQSGSPITQEEWAQHVPGASYDPPCVR